MQKILAKYLRFGKWFQNIRILYPYHPFFMVNVRKHTIVPWMRHGIDTPQLPVSPSLHVAPAPLSSSPANLKGPSPIQTKTTALLDGFSPRLCDFAFSVSLQDTCIFCPIIKPKSQKYDPYHPCMVYIIFTYMNC